MAGRVTEAKLIFSEYRVSEAASDQTGWLFPARQDNLKVKFLKAVRLDVSDSKIFAAEGALEDGEWVVSGGYAVCDLASGSHRQAGCRCDVSFIGLGNRKRCTLAEVVEMDETTYRQHIETLIRHFLEVLGAPSREAARAVAEEEISYTAEICESFEPGLWITVKRTPSEQGIKEHYSVFKRLMLGGHKL